MGKQKTIALQSRKLYSMEYYSKDRFFFDLQIC